MAAHSTGLVEFRALTDYFCAAIRFWGFFYVGFLDVLGFDVGFLVWGKNMVVYNKGCLVSKLRFGNRLRHKVWFKFAVEFNSKISLRTHLRVCMAG